MTTVLKPLCNLLVVSLFETLSNSFCTPFFVRLKAAIASRASSFATLWEAAQELACAGCGTTNP